MLDCSGSGDVWLFDVYGVTVAITSGDPQLGVHLAEDFEHFRVEQLASAPELSLSLHKRAPPYEGVPERPASVYTPRNVSFEQGGRTYIDYAGRALGIFDRASQTFDVYSEDEELLYEAGYLFLLSQLGERLDARGMHRIHALAVSVKNMGALVLLPMGGGKSTLGMHLLSDSNVMFLSDDSPLVDREGMLHAFPLRIGILPGSESLYSPDQFRTIQRMEFGPKLLLRHEFFADRVMMRVNPTFLFLGHRSLSDTCLIRPATRFTALKALMANCVIGLGLFQGMEFVFTRGSGEILSKGATVISRLRNCVALVRRSSPHTVVLGRNLEKNASTLLAFMEEHSS
ncbi:MAG: hypothetical protein WB439_00595 [Acidobacteriaceae bacterium]